MGGLGMLAAAEVRARWRSTAALALLVGLIGAVAIATVAGARRTGSALDRLDAESRAATVQVIVGQATAAQVQELRRVPGVTAAATLSGFFLPVRGAPNALAAVPVDGAWGRVVDRSRLVAGRRADRSRTDEVVLGESLAALLHLGVGDRLDTSSWTPLQVLRLLLGATDADVGAPAGPAIRLRIVGVVRLPLDLGRQGALGGVLAVTPAFFHRYSGEIGSFGTALRVRTAHGSAAELRSVRVAARRIFGPSPQFTVRSTAVERGGVQDAVDVLTFALCVFAGVAAGAGTIAVGIILNREAALLTDDQATLRALGVTRAGRVLKSGRRLGIVAGAGALLAGVGAYAGSWVFPVGVARRAERATGLRADWPVLLVGAAVVALLVLAIGLIAAVRSARVAPSNDPAGRRRVTTVADRAARAGIGPVATTGLRMALEPGRGRSAVPVRSAFLGAVLGVAAIAAVSVLTASLDHLVATPRLYGWTADLAAAGASGNGACNGDDVRAADVAGARAVAVACYGSDNVRVDGRAVNGWSFRRLRGAVGPEILSGRAPRTADEVALGRDTLDASGRQVGDRVIVRGTGAPHTYRIVGTAVFPTLGQPQPVADGALFTSTGFAPLYDQTNYFRYVLVRFGSDVDRASYRSRTTVALPTLFQATRPVVPTEVDRLRQVNWFPTTIAALLGALALIAVTYTLATSVRRHRRDLALLEVLGWRRRQVRVAVSWQATTVAVVGLAVGIPVGVVTGRLAWKAIADAVGVATAPTVPLAVVLLTIPAAILLANLAAALPARHAARTRPALALRAE